MKGQYGWRRLRWHQIVLDTSYIPQNAPMEYEGKQEAYGNIAGHRASSVPVVRRGSVQRIHLTSFCSIRKTVPEE